ncbi:unnamed protein product [Spirodela intermedia]|uniref:Uncharacterized protein n=1 Tax=Spirodela intermedia TaxID=51605 RepID=A0A7I8IGI0_SPIIN|nr:unnamed protein product [Spirodela intermedia]CAA6656813.1 unnamed protein product [Spirodela intermedia]
MVLCEHHFVITLRRVFPAVNINII